MPIQRIHCVRTRSHMLLSDVFRLWLRLLFPPTRGVLWAARVLSLWHDMPQHPPVDICLRNAYEHDGAIYVCVSPWCPPPTLCFNALYDCYR